MSLYLLPYEILQLIAENLLPRYQCRLGLTSRYCYKYLYTPLLAWHARAAQLRAPRCRIINNLITLVEINKTIVVYTYFYDSWINIDNLGKKTSKFIHNERISYAFRSMIDVVFGIIYRHGVGMFDGFYGYLSREILYNIISIRASPLLSLPSNVLRIIFYRFLPGVKLINLHVYLWHMFFIFSHTVNLSTININNFYYITCYFFINSLFFSAINYDIGIGVSR